MDGSRDWIAAQDLRELRAAYGRVFGGPDGRMVLEDLEQRGFWRSSSFSPDPARTAFNEGRRSLVIYLRRMLAPEA